MAKQKNGGGEGQNKGKRGRSDTEQARVYLRKAARVAKSNGKATLERYLGTHSNLRSFFPREVSRIVARARVIKPKAPPAVATS
ncbi:MAG: hypothetical protein ACRDKE_11305 [Solirubrobacterales bacterium]